MRRRLKPFLPRSLFGRAALILVLPVVVVQLIVSVAFIQRHFDGVTRQMTGGVSIEIRYIRARIDAVATPAQAQALALDLTRGLDLGLEFPLADSEVPTADSRAWFDYAGRAVTLTLYDRLSGVRAVDLTSNPLAVRVYLQTNKGPIRFEVKRSRISASNPHQLLVWMVFTSALMTFIAYIFLRNQLSPITRLARASDAFGKGQTIPYTPRGATEVRAAGNAFLNMRARIERQIESRTQMLSGVSHDLRTPLTRLKLGLSFLPEDEDTRALQQDVADMERLVDEFLAFARGDAMEEPEPVDPTALLHHIVENARRMGQPVTLGPASAPPGDAPDFAKLRPQAITRALENLIGNAVRHGTRVEVSLHSSERALRFVVEDDGPGIPKEHREEALEPFKRLDEARNPNKGGGVGLGLSIASDIARNHGGVLRLGESERLGGLRAEITIAR
ncbi:MAG: signal transduction kinase protein [Cypionkella sp.]|uniref:ATP-binding protein n=1 Tax=Cypionkella sp. TaxID=2811411 RepID=UPI0026290C0A|nr:ATP-binding protein [Cypionkella sp.]MDB5660252.1 signal transduction kinase protein [Cypionkella sp.]